MSKFIELVRADWKANEGNIKGRIVTLAFRVANAGASVHRPAVYILYPYIALYRIVVEWVLGIELPWRLRAGKGLRIDHGQGLVVNDRAVIGAYCTLRNSTTIGVARTDLTHKSVAPVLGDHVDVGANVVIIGPISVGSNVLIGAGSVVVKDIPAGSVAVGNPARVIRAVADDQAGANFP